MWVVAWVLPCYVSSLCICLSLSLLLSNTSVPGLTVCAHMPACDTGHYGFALTMQYLLPLLSGQDVDLSRGRLILNPRFSPPFTLPVLIAGCQASLRVEPAVTTENTLKGSTATLAVAFGSLELPAGGLQVMGSAYPSAVALKEGQSVQWTL